MSDRIVAQPEIHFGKPCVAGTRITVENVLELVREGIRFRRHRPRLLSRFVGGRNGVLSLRAICN